MRKLCFSKDDFRNTIKELYNNREKLKAWSRNAKLVMKKYTTLEISKNILKSLKNF